MNTDNLSFGQKIDEDNGLVMPWFTHGALDWIKEQDWRDKVVIMFGAGLGDEWLSKRCGHLHVVERNFGWLEKCEARKNEIYNVDLTYHFVPVNDCSGMDKEYLKIFDVVHPDIVINDDAYRFEVCVMAEKYFKNKEGGGILITDNWQQSYVFMCPAASELLDKYESKIFEQADHLDNDGINKWKTAIHFIK